MAKELGVVMDSEVGQPLGVTPLGEDGIVPEEYLPSTINEIKTDTEALREDAQQLQTDLTEAKADLTQAKTDLATVKTDLAAVKSDVSTIETDVGAVKTDTATVKTDVAAVKKDLAAAKTDLTQVKAGVEELKAERPKRYGFKRLAADSNPDTRIQYLFDAVGMTPAKMGAESFQYGDWGSAWFVAGNYPCMLKPDGTEAYKLNPNDYTKRADTGADSAATDAEGTLNAMAAFPTVWVKRYMEGKDECIVLCNQKYDASYHAYAHTDSTGRVKPTCYHAIYEGSLDSESKVRSLSGQRPWSTTGGFDTERTNVKKNGANWDIRTWAFNILIADELTLMAKSDNSQKSFGQGHTTGGSKAEDLHTTGALNTKGQFWGDTVGTTSDMKVFHMENYWGDRWDRLAGLIQTGGTYLVKMTPENGGYNATGAGYDAFPAGLGTVTAVSSGWQHETYTSDLGTLPVGGTFNGTETTYTCDFFWWNTGIVSVALAGGDCGNGGFCGSRSLAVNLAAAASSWSIGPSLFFV